MSGRSPSSGAPAHAGFMTVRLGRHRFEARPNEDRCGGGLHREGAALQPPLPADVQPLPRATHRLHPGQRMGEGPGREPGRAGARAVLHAPAAGQKPGRAERLADGQMRGLRQGAPPSRTDRQDDLGDVRSRAAAAGALCRPLRRLPQRACPLDHCSRTNGEQGLVCRRPARCGSTTTSIPCWPRRSGDPSMSMPMPTGPMPTGPAPTGPVPTGSSSGRMGWWSQNIPAPLVGVRRSMILGTMCLFSPANLAPCAMVPHSRTGCCRRPWLRSDASSRAAMMVIARWSRS